MSYMLLLTTVSIIGIHFFYTCPLVRRRNNIVENSNNNCLGFMQGTYIIAITFI